MILKVYTVYIVRVPDRNYLSKNDTQKVKRIFLEVKVKKITSNCGIAYFFVFF